MDKREAIHGEGVRRRTLLKAAGLVGFGFSGSRYTEAHKTAINQGLTEMHTAPSSPAGADPEGTSCDLTGLWLDGGREVDIVHDGDSVIATFREPEVCEYTDDTDDDGDDPDDDNDGDTPPETRTAERDIDFRGTLTGNTIEGETSTCVWGGPDGCSSNGVVWAPFELTVSDDCTELNGTWYSCLYDEWQGMTLTRPKQILSVDGLLGDVIEIDFLETGLGEFELVPDQTATDEAIPSGHETPAIDIGYVAQVEEWEDKLRSTGVLWFVPIDEGTGSLQLRATDSDGVEYVVIAEIAISDGYSTMEQNAVTFGTEKLDIYRQQQRLKYFEFPDPQGNQLQADGVNGTRTNWARGLFCDAVSDRINGRNHSPRERFDDRGEAFINAVNAPRWVELTAGPGYTIGASQPERWGTSYAQEVLSAAGHNNHRTAMEMIGASLEPGGDTRFHLSHETGMDIDIETPSTNDTRVPFYQTHTIDGRQYVAAADLQGDDGPRRRIIARRNGQYVAVEFNQNGSALQGGLAHEEATYDNEQVLGDIVDLIVSPAGYDLDVIRTHINAFRAVELTPSGATVGTIWYNDPRTWDISNVSHEADHGGHFHVNVNPPAEAWR